MAAEENKALVRRWIDDLFNEGNLAVADEIVAPGHVNHDPATPGIAGGPEGSKQIVGLYRGAFPDVRLSIDDQIAEGDRVVTRWTARGTHRGDLMGIAPTGKQATVTGVQVNRIEGGKIAETWVNWDTLSLMQQIGAVPAPGQSGA